MTRVTAYSRPTSLEEALVQLAEPATAVLAGGTRLTCRADPTPVAVVDIQDLGLGAIGPGRPGVLVVGAMATLAELAGCEMAPAAVREAARRERPSTLRAQGTVGGCVASGDWDSELLATLLAHDATVSAVDPSGAGELPLADFLAGLPLPRDRVVTAVSIRVDGTTAAARTARTPADRPIVAAVARRADDGVRLALCGVAARPVLVADPAAVDPPGDFRGSSEYRRHLAVTLSGRVIHDLT